MSDTTLQPNEAAQRGLKLLSKQHLKLHPRAQVQTLRRIAVRALSQADSADQYTLSFGLSGFDTAPDPKAAYAAEQDRVRKLRQKAKDASEAMLHLNRVHRLGYPVA